MAAASSTTTTVVQPPVAAAAPPADGGFDIGGDAMPADVGGPAPQPDAPQDGGGDADAPAGDPAVQQPANPGAQAPAYQYSSAPRAISGGTATGAMSATRQKYRDPATVTRKANIMHDKRVIRGNTRAAQVPTASQKIILDEEQKKLMRRRAAAEARRKKVLEEVEKTPYDPLTAPVEGRAHMTIQTDEHQLEEITDKPTEADVSTQTEDDVDAKPLPPLFMPKPPGRDQQTSIEPGELFDFNLSVEPILEVLIGKTLDQALTEVLEEQELSALKAQRAWFEQQKATELAQVQQLEAEAKRKFEEKEARMREARTRALAEQRVQEKNAAQLMAKQFLSTLQDNTLNKLESAGHFYDPVRRDVEHTFMPWLLDATQRAVGARAAARAQLDDLLRAAMVAAQKSIDETLRKRREAKDQAERDRLSAIAAAESARLAALQAAADAAAREVAERAALEESLKKRAAAAEEAAAQAKADAKAEAKKKRDAELRKKLGALAE